MGATLEALLALQDVELQIVDIRRQLAAKQRNVQRQAAKLRGAEAALAAARDDLKHTQAEMDSLDLDLKGRGANITRLRDNLNTVRTNKEYAAILSQLNTQKADVSRLEARAFQLLESVEAKKRSIAEHQQTVAQEAARLANLQAQLEQAQQSFAQRLRDLEQQREAAAERVDGAALALFNRVSEHYDGEVMARVVRTHPRRDEYMCDGCNMGLAIERANALLTRDELITCDNCGRILYIEKES